VRGMDDEERDECKEDSLDSHDANSVMARTAFGPHPRVCGGVLHRLMQRFRHVQKRARSYIGTRFDNDHFTTGSP
jgi:hypothetical protein